MAVVPTSALYFVSGVVCACMCVCAISKLGQGRGEPS